MGTVITRTDGADVFLAEADTAILGRDGDDTLTAGGRNGVLVGNAGDDVLIGSTFEDVLGGSEGDNTLTGGVGADVFVMAVPVGEDGVALQTITDFEVGSDRIGLPLGLTVDDVEVASLKPVVIAQETPERGPAGFDLTGPQTIATQIRLRSTGAVLAVLPGVESDRLGNESFALAETLEFGASEFRVREDGTALAAITITRSFPELSRLTTGFNYDLVVSRAGGIGGDLPDDRFRGFIFGGDRTLTVSLPFTNDAVPEPDEVFSLQLIENSERFRLGRQSTAQVTVVDDDDQPPVVSTPGVIGLGSSLVRVNENDGTATVEVLRSGGSDGIVAAVVSVEAGTAIAGQDFVAAPEPAVVVFDNGDVTPKTVTIPLLDDQLQEDLESFTVTLGGVTGGASLGAAATTVEIVDQDLLPVGLVEFATPSLLVTEGVALVSVPVVRTEGSRGRVTVNVAVSGQTAVEGVDFGSPPGAIGLVFEDGETGPKEITFAIADDGLVENLETFALTLFNPTGGITLGATQTATVVIQDNDGIPKIVDFAAAGDLTPFPVDPLTGVRFSDNTVGLVNFDGGGSGNFVDPLLPPLNPARAATYTGFGTMLVNVDTGFRDRLSFRYSAPFALDPAIDPDGDGFHEVLVFDGPDGTGNVLAIAKLPLTQDTGLPVGAFGLTADPFEVSFSGIARSVAIGSEGDRLVIDDLTFG